MPLDPEHAANVNRAFATIKSLNELDQQEVRNVVRSILCPTLREAHFRLNYQRAAINIELLLTLTDAKQFQAITTLTRMVFETAVELKLLLTIPDAAEKVQLFMELEKLKAARKIVAYQKSHPDDKLDVQAQEQFIPINEHRLDQEKKRMWPSVKSISHWSLMNMEQRTDSLGGAYQQIYQRYYPLLSWYVHSGITGVTNPTGEVFAHLCGLTFTIASECYALILESIIDEFRLQKADEKLIAKIQFARMLPFADTSQQVDELRRALLGE